MINILVGNLAGYHNCLRGIKLSTIDADGTSTPQPILIYSDD